MTTATAPAATTSTLAVPGAILTYDVRSVAGSAYRPLLVIGCPMGASGFGTLAGHFTDRTVVTCDPRGVERSTKDDPASQSTPDQHADDLHRLIETLGIGPVDVFGSSGGAVNALALVATHPADVRRVVAHEPPLAGIVPDADAALAACRAAAAAYQRAGSGVGMAWFMILVSHQGPFTAEMANMPDPDPAMFGMPAEDDGRRDDALLGQNLLTLTAYQPDVAALRGASTDVVLAVGEESGAALARRAGEQMGELIGRPAVLFPSDHGGFLGGEYGQMGKPDDFAAKVREVLDA